MLLGPILAGIGLFLAIGVTASQEIMMFNLEINIGDESITSLHIGITCMVIGTFLVIRDYWKRPEDSLIILSR